jgi:hypothetical protein
MQRRNAKLQAAALRLAAERVESGKGISAELEEALAVELELHPEDADQLAAIDEGPLPEWLREEIKQSDREESESEDAHVFFERIAAERRRRSA